MGLEAEKSYSIGRGRLILRVKSYVCRVKPSCFIFLGVQRLILCGGNSSMFYVHPESWGFMIQFDLRIFFKRVGKRPLTSKYQSKGFTQLEGLDVFTCSPIYLDSDDEDD